MKINKFFMGMLGALALVSCSSESMVPNEPGNPESTDGKFMAISISTSSSDFGTRAEGDAEGDEKKDYEYGIASENAVKTLDFYFFDSEGNPATVKADNTNHVKADKFTTGEGEGENIEETINAVILISTQAGDKAEPAQIVAVVNEGVSGSCTGKKLSELQAAIADGTMTSEGTKYFTMTNSVYVQEGIEQIGVSVEGKLFSSEEAALANPVTIYVERILAKVRMVTSLTPYKTLDDGTVLYETKDEKGYNENEIYVKFLGWNVTATSDKARFVKDINPAWTTNDWVWNSADYHRSFWALNAPENKIQWGAFKASDTDNDENSLFTPANLNSCFVDPTDKEHPQNIVYIKENAATDETYGKDPEYPTQVIIAAQLVDKDGKPMEFAEWAFQRMTVENLNKAIANSAPLYYGKTTTAADGSTTINRTHIEPKDIKLITAMQAGKITDQGHPGDKGTYYVYATLTDDAKEKTWYKSDKKDAEAIRLTDVQGIFNSLGGAKVWTQGYTYYFFDIKHLNRKDKSTEFGVKGIVRNHLYASDIKTLAGLGTPVFDPSEVIYPEKPVNEETFIAAEIKVLSWRIVPNDVDLDWK